MIKRLVMMIILVEFFCVNRLHLHHIISMRHTRETNNIWIEIQNSIEYKTHRKLVFYDTCVNEHKHCSI